MSSFADKPLISRFFITIDTEEDMWGNFRSFGHTVENIGQIPRVQDIFDRYGAIPTYLVTYPVVKDDFARALLLDLLSRGRCDIGTHCHPWNTPPFKEELNEWNSMLSNLPYELVAQKIETLHREVNKSLGVVPRCFRAGRWGFGPNVAKVIYDLGYRVDTSVTPFVDWSIYGGPDYREAPWHIYRFTPDAILLARHDGCLWEVPATTGFFQNNFDRCGGMARWLSQGIPRRLHLSGILERTKILNFRWLSPELSSGREMITLAKTCLYEGCCYLNLSFHSNSLLPGRTPFVRTRLELESFLDSIEQLLQFAVSKGLIFSPLSDVFGEN